MCFDVWIVTNTWAGERVCVPCDSAIASDLVARSCRKSSTALAVCVCICVNGCVAEFCEGPKKSVIQRRSGGVQTKDGGRLRGHLADVAVHLDDALDAAGRERACCGLASARACSTVAASLLAHSVLFPQKTHTKRKRTE